MVCRKINQLQPPICQLIPGSGYYHNSNAMRDTNTVQEKATSVMCDSDTFFYVASLFLIALRIS